MRQVAPNSIDWALVDIAFGLAGAIVPVKVGRDGCNGWTLTGRPATRS
jgi:hypothetical protein